MVYDPDHLIRIAGSLERIEMLIGVHLTAAPPVGIAEVAELFGVKSPTVHQWRARGLFPEPDFQVGGSPAWVLSTFREWGEATLRYPRMSLKREAASDSRAACQTPQRATIAKTTFNTTRTAPKNAAMLP